MRNIIILIFTLFSVNYSFGQMKVYAGENVNNTKNLVGVIYESGEVYRYTDGKEQLFGIVRNNKFYIYNKNNSEEQAGSVLTLTGIELYWGTDKKSMAGFVDGLEFYYGKDKNDKSKMMGFFNGSRFSNLGTGKYFAAYFLLMLYYNN